MASVLREKINFKASHKFVILKFNLLIFVAKYESNREVLRIICIASSERTNKKRNKILEKPTKIVIS
jgi:hypothetical protein